MEAKSWRQLQEEREALMTRQIQKTEDEAVSFWDRARAEDSKRVNAIMTEKQRIEDEARKREEIMARGNEERLEKDRLRKVEIARQEQLLSGRLPRARTEAPAGAPGPGIQVFHYKDPEVEEIVRNTNKEAIRRRMSHGELLRGFNPDQASQASHGSPTEEEKAMFFNAQVMLRSQSSSSTTSR